MIRKFLLAFGLLGFTSFSYAQATPFGMSLSIPVIKKDPADLHGYRLATTFQPPSFVWKNFNVYFDFSYGHWYVNQGPYRTLNSYAIAPYLRFYFSKNPVLSPYIEASIGPTYLTKTRLDGRNQGIHFSFQDQLGVGVAMGPDQRFFMSLSALHYSNGSIAKANAGITVYTMLNVGCRF